MSKLFRNVPFFVGREALALARFYRRLFIGIKWEKEHEGIFDLSLNSGIRDIGAG